MLSVFFMLLYPFSFIVTLLELQAMMGSMNVPFKTKYVGISVEHLYGASFIVKKRGLENLLLLPLGQV